MKNKTLLLLLIFCFAFFGVARAEVVTIGTGTSNNQNSLPVKSDWNYFLTQQIFTAEEIGTGGAINAISFNYTNSCGAFSMSSIQVYMKNISKTEFEGRFDMVQVSPSDKVFDGSFSASGAGWVTVNLDNPFTYDGSSNLLICFYSPVNNFVGSNIGMFYYTTNPNIYQGIAYYSSSYIDITNMASYNGASAYYTFRSNIQIDITPMEAIPYQTGFEEATPLANWTVLTGTSDIQNSSSNSHSGTYYLRFRGSTSNIVVLPQFASPTNNLRLEFWTRPESYSNSFCGSFSVGYMTDLEDASSFVAIETYSYDDWTSNTYVKKIVDFNVEGVPANAYIAMRHYDCSTVWYWFVDDVTVKVIPPCDPPTNFQVSDLTYNYAWLSWEPEEGDYDVEYKAASATEWIVRSQHIGPGCGFGGSENIEPYTTYNVRVKRNCPNGNATDWEETSFTTFPVPMTIPFSESFDATSIPDRWAKYTGLLNDVMAGTATLTPYDGGWNFDANNGVFDTHARLNIWNNTTKYWLVTPQVTMQNNCQLSFELALTKYSGTMQPVDPTLQPDDRFVVLASTNNGSTWTILREWNNTGSPYVYNNILASSEDVAIDLTAYQGTDLTIAFYGESTIGSNGDNNLHIDNVSINYIPACQKPTNFHVSDIAPHSVVLSWDAPEGQNHWEVGYKTDDDPYYIWFVEPTENPYLFSGHPGRPLLPETHYTVKVRALCDGSGSSTWSKEVEFTTPTACPAPTDVTVLSTTAHGFWASFTPGGDWQTSWYFTWTTENVAPTYGGGTTTDPEGFGVDNVSSIFAGTTYYLWMGIYCEEDETYHWAEPVQFTTSDACPAVDVSHDEVVIEDIQPHSVSLSWYDYQGMATEWQVYYSLYDGLPYDENYINEVAVVTDEPYVTINGLIGDYNYHFWIRSRCEDWNGTPQYSQWSEMITVHTLVSCPEPVNLVASTTANSATITWAPGGNENHWTVEIKSDDWGDYLPSYPVDEPTITFDEELLSSLWGDGICYDRGFTVYVTAECGDPDGSSEAAELDFIVTDKEFLTVYDGEDINDRIPAYIYFFDDFTRSQFVIPADDLLEMAGSPVYSMTFYTTNNYVPYTTVSLANVYLLEVNYTEMSAFEPDGEFVYGGYFEIVSTANGGQMTITFDEPYYYQGGNLLVSIENTEDIGWKHIYFYGQEVDGASISGSSDDSLDDVEPTQQNFIPKTTFGFIPTCEARTLPYSYGFEDANELDCWTMLNCVEEEEGEVRTGISEVAAHQGGHGFQFYYTTTPPQYLISPKFSASTQMVVSFYFKNESSYYDETFQVGYSTTTKSPDSFIWTKMLTANDNTTWKLFKAVLPVGTKYIAIKHTSYDQLRLQIDDFSVVPALCTGPNLCELNFELTDNYGDTWSGNAIKVVDAETGIVLGMLTNDYNQFEASYSYGTYTETKTLPVCDGRELRFEWVKGNDSDECSFIITDINGDVVFSDEGTYYDDGELIATHTVNCSYLFVSDGDWNDPDNWRSGKVAPAGKNVTVTADAVIPEGYVANARWVTLDGGSITVADGGQLKHSTTGLEVTLQKDIVGYGDANNTNNYYLLGFPFIEDIDVPDEMTTDGCDLYMFTPYYQDAEWYNYREAPFGGLTAVEGYLFASPNDMELSVTGPTYRSTTYYTSLNYSEGSGDSFDNWLLLGNFLTCDAFVYKRVNDEFIPMEVMVYNEEGEMVTIPGGPIAPMQGYFIKLTEPTALYFRTEQLIPEGAIDGKFTINDDGDQVYFSKGNLQYTQSTQTWSFMEQQYDIVETTGSVGDDYANQDVVSLFGWGTSGYNHGAVCYQPWNTNNANQNYWAYGDGSYNLYDQTGQADWGYNPISNGGNMRNQWHTLTHQQWRYLFNTRTTNTGIRFARALVNNVKGMILLPDEWETCYYVLYQTNNSTSDWSYNTISAEDWTTLEEHGAVFLPEAGFRVEETVVNSGNTACYWSSSENNAYNAGCVNFNDGYFSVSDGMLRSRGVSVRLVCPAY